ncbi:peptide chain release factor N(5)-glutamine methyltransferase [Stenotrophomonas sp.]|uniref:peptide chain release factor N(5)-glutamine methyltransferase n=1 Tax=Stenotrophomonas sp. TaxID=69392 RepID=UPI0028AE5BB9|nr:peptide chain release factor N(5)-glutamine methyltransferase [Stenotrophomonas sp.]
MTAAPQEIRQLLADAARDLPGVEARHEAELLLLHVLGRDRSWLFAHATDPVDADIATAFHVLLQRRTAGEPVAYLLGRRGFWTLDLAVSPATLIPRPETERLVELALDRLPGDQPLRIADLGTGSGAIALALASERPLAQVLATDLSAEALAVAGANARQHALGNVGFRQGGWYAPLAGERFDLIASNPPYIASDDPHLARGDLRFEPATALASGPDGLDDIRQIIDGAPDHLRPGGWLLLEHGWDQGGAIRALLDAHGFVDVATEVDLEQRDRVSLGRLPGTPGAGSRRAQR